MANKNIAAMTQPELVHEITESVNIRTSKALVEFSREDLLRLVACIKGYCGTAPVQEEAS